MNGSTTLNTSTQSTAALKRYIERGEIRYAAQPINPVAGEEGDDWYEWLVRPELPNLDLSVEQFVETVESLGLSLALDRRASRDAMRWLGQQQASTRLTINLSGSTLAHRRFVTEIIGLTEQFNILPFQLCFDLSVRDRRASLAGINRFIREIRQFGCSVALHEGVPGNPLMGMMGPLGLVDFMKIDRDLVAQAADSQSHRHTLESVVDYGRRLGTTLIALGVDSHHSLRMMKDLGIDFYQGFIDGEPQLVAKPSAKMNSASRSA